LVFQPCGVHLQPLTKS